MKTTAVSRRNALGGAATIGLGLPLLAACGDDAGGGAATEPSQSPSSSAPASEPPASTPTTKNPKPANGIATTSEVPVGSGVVLGDEEVVITQPTEGEFKAFTAICTHQGCTVVDVTDTINCTCHFSTFSITDGSPTGGPAPTPLAEIPISVDGNQISLA